MMILDYTVNVKEPIFMKVALGRQLFVKISYTEFEGDSSNNRCRYQSITQQYLKRSLIKNNSNYMFRPIVAIIRFSSESMVVVVFRIGI